MYKRQADGLCILGIHFSQPVIQVEVRILQNEWSPVGDIVVAHFPFSFRTFHDGEYEMYVRMYQFVEFHTRRTYSAGIRLTPVGATDVAGIKMCIRDSITALPMEVPVCYQEVAHCLEKSISKVETAILSALENTPPELYADIVHNGIYLAGGGALLRGLDKRLTDKINIPFHIAEDPLHAVAKGTGVALKNVDRFSFLMR